MLSTNSIGNGGAFRPYDGNVRSALKSPFAEHLHFLSLARQLDVHACEAPLEPRAERIMTNYRRTIGPHVYAVGRKPIDLPLNVPLIHGVACALKKTVYLPERLLFTELAFTPRASTNQKRGEHNYHGPNRSKLANDSATKLRVTHHQPP